jgi:3-oxoacyl-[acyl-carrier-protein] synthase-3
MTKMNAGKISGIVTSIPSLEINNSYFLDRFSETEVQNIEKMGGVTKRYWVKDNQSASDLCFAAGEELIAGLSWDRNAIDAVIYVSQSPDYILPATAIKLAGRLGLSPGIIAYDVNLGCSGYPYGLFLAESMIQSGIASRVLLAAGETTSKLINQHDKSTAMIFGDAGSVTAIEKDANSQSVYILGSDALGEMNLIIPNSKFCGNVMAGDPRIVDRDPNYLYMDGAEIFNFTLKRVPELVRVTEEVANIPLDYYLFHQANKFMLNHLVKKMKIDPKQAPINISDFGNTSSVSIPLLMTTTIKTELKSKPLEIGMFGFGVGYSWGSCAKKVTPDIFLKNIQLND